MILFLDFDGVLHHHDVFVDGASDGKRFPAMRGPGALMQWAPNLKSILSSYPEVQVIVSSKWVWWFGLDFCRSALPPELAAKVIGATWEGSWAMPEGWVHLPRCEQIRLHVRRYGIKDWSALDDDSTGLAESDTDRFRFVICTPERGISDPAVLLELVEKLTR